MNTGHTLIELLVVVVIIGIIMIMALIWNPRNIQGAKVTSSIATITEIKRAYSLYRTDTQTVPEWHNLTNANSLFTDPGVSGWRGPYADTNGIPEEHPWRGHIGWHGENGDCGYAGAPPSCPDRDNSSASDFIIILDDDAPNTSGSDNSSPIPPSALEKIDSELDDGDLSTGRVQGNAEGDFGGLLPTEQGELAIWVF